MDTEAKLLELLGQPGVHSGTELGEQLGISRVAVKKRISGLIEQGLPVKAIAGKGYELLEGVELLSQANISNAIPSSTFAYIDRIEIHNSLASTNSYLSSQTDTMAGKARAVLAESQPGGKGRYGRGWSTTPYRNLMLSVGWSYPQWPQNPAALSLAFAVAIHQALVSAGCADAQIKWPNDILLNGKKIAGLLVDATGEATGSCHLIFGVGINFYIDSEAAKPIDQPWDHLSSVSGANQSRNQMAAAVIGNLVETILLYEREGFVPFVDYWNKNAAYVGEEVRLFNDKEEYKGELLGVDKSGELTLKDYAGHRHRFNQANISLRPL